MPDAVPVVVLGGNGVGKSCLTIQYVQGHFVDEHDATIEDVYRKEIPIGNCSTTLVVVDTAGQDTFGAMRDQYLRRGHGFVLVYSITDAESFQHVRRLYSHLQRMRVGRPVSCVLVGNKVDQEAYRAVRHDSGAELALEMNAPFLEVTAKSHAMSEEVFEAVLHSIRRDARADNRSSDELQSGLPSDAARPAGETDINAPHTARVASPASLGNRKGGAETKKKRKHHRCAVI